MLNADSMGWFRVKRAVDKSIDVSFRYLVICLQNDDSIRNSIVGLDNIEICSSPTSATSEPKHERLRLRIFPNPNAGSFTVELPASATPGMSFRILSLTGQLLGEQRMQIGNTTQRIMVENLSAGLFFLQVISDGKVLAVEKFVKQ